MNLIMLGWLGYLLFIAKDPENEMEEYAMALSIFTTYACLVINNILKIWYY